MDLMDVLDGRQSLTSEQHNRVNPTKYIGPAGQRAVCVCVCVWLVDWWKYQLHSQSTNRQGGRIKPNTIEILLSLSEYFSQKAQDNGKSSRKISGHLLRLFSNAFEVAVYRISDMKVCSI